MPLNVDVIVKSGEGGKKTLSRLRRFEALLLPLSSSRWLMRVFRAIVQSLADLIVCARQDFTLNIDGAPEIHLLAADLRKHFIEVPSGTWVSSSHAKLFRVLPPEFLNPTTDRFV